MRSEKRLASTTGGDIAYVDAGEGPDVLLIHGFPTSSYLWRREVALLSSRMRVVAPDLLGYGDSEKPTASDLSISAQARYLAELLGQLGMDHAAIVGHDIGGGVAQLLALSGRAAALVLLDSICFDAWPIEGVRTIQETPRERQTGEFVESLVRRTFDLGLAKHKLDEPTLAAYAKPWREDPPAFFRAARGIGGVGLEGREGDLGALDLPAFVVWGEDDPFLPSDLAERLGETIPMSMTALLPGCSHFVNEDAWQTVDQLIHEFLRLRYLGESHGHGAGGPVPIYLRPPTPEEVAAADADPE
ncbi:MAG: alpha/beta fold hydrolase [Actinomycetota bacterium]